MSLPSSPRERKKDLAMSPPSSPRQRKKALAMSLRPAAPPGEYMATTSTVEMKVFNNGPVGSEFHTAFYLLDNAYDDNMRLRSFPEKEKLAQGIRVGLYRLIVLRQEPDVQFPDMETMETFADLMKNELTDLRRIQSKVWEWDKYYHGKLNDVLCGGKLYTTQDASEAKACLVLLRRLGVILPKEIKRSEEIYRPVQERLSLLGGKKRHIDSLQRSITDYRRWERRCRGFVAAVNFTLPGVGDSQGAFSDWAAANLKLKSYEEDFLATTSAELDRSEAEFKGLLKVSVPVGEHAVEGATDTVSGQ